MRERFDTLVKASDAFQQAHIALFDVDHPHDILKVVGQGKEAEQMANTLAGVARGVLETATMIEVGLRPTHDPNPRDPLRRIPQDMLWKPATDRLVMALNPANKLQWFQRRLLLVALLGEIAGYQHAVREELQIQAAKTKGIH